MERVETDPGMQQMVAAAPCDGCPAPDQSPMHNLTEQLAPADGCFAVSTAAAPGPYWAIPAWSVGLWYVLPGRVPSYCGFMPLAHYYGTGPWA